MNQEPIQLLQCYHCQRLQYPSKRAEGIVCKCGSGRAVLAPPTFMNRVKYILREVPGIHNKLRELFAHDVVDIDETHVKTPEQLRAITEHGNR